MPELPEVAAALRRVRPHLLRQRIQRLQPLHPAVARHLPPAARRRAVGRTIVRLERRGKYQLFHCDDGTVLLAHFRMTGDWQPVAPQHPLPAHTRLVIHCASGTRVALVDPRVLGTLTVHPPHAPPALALGPEPLARGFTPAVLAQALAGKRTALKLALLDQRIVAGLGNIYAAEACWVAALDPARAAGTLAPAECTRLVQAIKQVLREAPTGRYWQRAAGPDWAVYDREGQPCRRCHTPIARVPQGGRSTYWCPGCQRGATTRARSAHP
jgi:formamidopyrimidine-DNA glycosylase